MLFLDASMRGHLVPWSKNNPNTRVLRTMLILKVRMLKDDHLISYERNVRKQLWGDEGGEDGDVLDRG